MPSYDGIDIHFFEGCPAVFDQATRDDFERADLFASVSAVMGFDIRDDDISAPSGTTGALIQHRERLAHTRGGTEIDAQLTAAHD